MISMCTFTVLFVFSVFIINNFYFSLHEMN